MNSNRMNPIELSEKIIENYKRYLTTTFNIKDKQLKQRLREKIQDYSFSRGPYIETIPNFKKGASINQLIEKGDLSTEFRRLNSDTLPLERHLYLHQMNAIQTISVKKRNAVIATGTGSGKTECYLIPIINYLMRQKESGNLTPGVRAVLLYPMNALANDQMKRIRELLMNYEAISFGTFTGETQEDQKRAYSHYYRLYHQEPLNNEMISREVMRKSPPHILLTNYSMLEYLLLRPKDTPLFDGAYSDNWKFIVLDEAHSYRGAKAIEMAMQMRRLVQRVSNKNKIQFIATSATLSSEQGLSKTAEFASKLFTGSIFTEEDIIFSEKEALRENISTSFWVPEKTTIYNEIRELIVQSQNSETNKGFKSKKINSILKKYQIPKKTIEKIAENSSLQECLFKIFDDNQHMVVIKRELEEETLTFEELEQKNAYLNLSAEEIYSLLLIGNYARYGKGHSPLLPIRFHFFVKASEGLFVYRDQDGFHPLLERNELFKAGNQTYKVFEFATCKQCGASYLIGNEDQENGTLELNDLTDSPEKYTKSAFLILSDEEFDEFKNEKKHKKNLFRLCTRCGNLKSMNLFGKGCDHADDDKLYILRADKYEGIVNKCHSCGKQNSKTSIVYPFFFSKEAISSILTNVMYQNLQEPENKPTNFDSEWDEMPKTNPLETKRKLLVFSDNRQDAAFFAPYLKSTYEQILWKRLIIFVLNKYREKIIENKWNLDELAKKLKKEAINLGVMKSYSAQEIEEKTKQMVFREFLSNETNALENLGFLKFKHNFPEIHNKVKEFFGEHVEEFLDNLVLIMRESNIVKPMIDLEETDDFKFKQKEIFFEGGKSEKWKPLSKAGNKFSDYYLRVRDLKILDNLYEKIFLKFLNVDSYNILKEGSLDYKDFYIIPLSEDDSIYVCDQCGKTTPYNYREVCPTKGCAGTLRKKKIKGFYENNHYYNVYQNMDFLNMSVEEHTAQWKHEKALKTQNDFTEGKINVLSCSTTFELGVDLGDLESVLLKNMPPTPANYVQRAGRAGRRVNVAAFVITYCLRRSHDLSFFNTPGKMINGEMNPPEFEIQNDKIIKRHIYATAFSFFWKLFDERFDKVEDFFIEDSAGKNGADLFRDYLESKPEELKQALIEILPPNCVERYHIHLWGWLNEHEDDLLSPSGPLERTSKRVSSEIEQLDKAKEEFRKGINSKNRIYYQSNIRRLDNIKNTLLLRSLLNFLSNNNLLPKYGFPVDIVGLNLFSSDPSMNDIELTRDLKIALSEYAPGNSVVAAGKLWESNYIKKPFDQKHWEERVYYHCNHCGWFEEYFLTDKPEIHNCKRCGKLVDETHYIVPEFGFVSTSAFKKVKSKKPVKFSFSRRFFSEDNKMIGDLPYHTHQFKNALLNLKSFSDGKLTVINEGTNHNGFFICETCGYASPNLSKREHDTFYGKKCLAPQFKKHISLGYSFKTDILKLHFEICDKRLNDETLWYSLLYTILEKMASLYSIDRDDIDGCLYFPRNTNVELIFFDDFPGGAGHVKRAGENILENPEYFFSECLDFVSNCECGEESSCYSCLRSYKNQLFHQKLKRKVVIDFLREELGVSL